MIAVSTERIFYLLSVVKKFKLYKLVIGKMLKRPYVAFRKIVPY